MKLRFGWELDGARLADSAVGTAVVGPRGLISLLEVRLGLGQAREDHTFYLRLAAMRQAIVDLAATPEGQWFAQSARLNSWATARYLLRVRDFLVSCGWEPRPDDDTLLASSQRLRALAALERLLRQEPSWLAYDSFKIAEVKRALSEHSWPVGIDTIEIMHCRIEQLPAVYREIFKRLQELGVSIVENPPAHYETSVDVIEADTQWEAAALAARVIARYHRDKPSRAGRPPALSVLAGIDTTALDSQLTSRGLLPIGVRDIDGVDVVGSFLAAVTAPLDVQALVSLLHMNFPAADGSAALNLINRKVASALLAALNSSAGAGGAQWQEAIGQPWDERHQEIVELIDRWVVQEPVYLDESSEQPVDLELVKERLRWLAGRLNRLSRIAARQLPSDPTVFNTSAQAQELTAAAAQVSGALVALDRVTGPISARELMAIIAASRPAEGLSLDAVPANPNLVVETAPGRLPGGELLLWWAPLAETVSSFYPLTSSEHRLLTDAGWDIPTAEHLAELAVTSQLGALRSYQHVLVVYPKLLAGEPAVLNSLVDFLPSSTTLRAPELYTQQPAASSAATMATAAATSPQRHAIADPTFEVSLPELTPSPVRNPVEVSLSPGEQLMPRYLSHSQITQLLSRPAEWALRYPLRLKQAAGAEVPTGSRMLGLLMHKIAEELFYSQREAQPTMGPVKVTEQQVAAEFDRLVPQYAAELLLPGSHRDKREQRQLAIDSLTVFFNHLYEQGITITAMESGLGENRPADATYQATPEGEIICPEIIGADGQPIVMRGYRDVDIMLPDGQPGVIDLKYSRHEDKFITMVGTGEATQLAIYAASIVRDGQSLDQVPVGFYTLRDMRLVSRNDALLGGRWDNPAHTAKWRETTGDLDQLWQAMVYHLNWVFAHMRAGTVSDIDTAREIYELTWPEKENRSYNKNMAAAEAAFAALAEDFPQLAADIRHLSNTGFIPAKPNGYPNFSRILGS